MPSNAEAYGPLSGFVFDTTPPTRIVSLVTPGWSTAVALAPLPPFVVELVSPLPDLELEALLQAATRRVDTAKTAITRVRMKDPQRLTFTTTG